MKARQVFERALAFINERDSSGAYHTDIGDFEANAPDIINACISLLLVDECIIRRTDPKEFKWEFEPIKTLDDPIPLHEALACAPLPYLVASHLLIEEDMTRAQYFHNLSQLSRQEVQRAFASAVRTSVTDVY